MDTCMAGERGRTACLSDRTRSGTTPVPLARAMRADACRQHDVRGLGLRTSLRSAPRALKAKYGWSPEFDGTAHQLRNPGIMPHRVRLATRSCEPCS